MKKRTTILRKGQQFLSGNAMKIKVLLTPPPPKPLEKYIAIETLTEILNRYDAAYRVSYDGIDRQRDVPTAMYKEIIDASFPAVVKQKKGAGK